MLSSVTCSHDMRNHIASYIIIIIVHLKLKREHYMQTSVRKQTYQPTNNVLTVLLQYIMQSRPLSMHDLLDICQLFVYKMLALYAGIIVSCIMLIIIPAKLPQPYIMEHRCGQKSMLPFHIYSYIKIA